MKPNLITTTLLLTSASAIAEPNITISTTTNSRDFPLSAEQPLVVPLTKDGYTLKITGVEGDCVAPDGQKVKFNKPIALNCGKPTELPLKIRFTGDKKERLTTQHYQGYAFGSEPNWCDVECN